MTDGTPLQRLTGVDAYDRLPEPIKALYSLREWQWLPDAQKSTLVESSCEPEWDQ